MKKSTINQEAGTLYKKTEDLLKKNPAKIISQLDKAEMQKLILELKSHLKELKKENSGMVLTQTAAKKYTDLYNFAPSGYFTLSNSGEIIELNRNGAKLLGKRQAELINKEFISFISEDTKVNFDLFLRKVFNSKSKQTCIVIIKHENNKNTYVNLSGITVEAKERCLITAVDFTGRKNIEDFNKTLLSSLPYPAMYIRQKDRVIIAANKIALNYGAKIGGYCWQDFGKSKYISQEVNEIDSNQPDINPVKSGLKCTFCLGDKCIYELPTQNNREVKAFGKIWDIYWVKVSDEIFLHYLVDITERMEMEDALLKSEKFLKQTQQIAMLGTFTLDLDSGSWIGSQVLNTIFGIKANFDKTLESWITIIHPEWRKRMYYYFKHDVIKNKFDKEFKIIRQSDKSVRWVHGIGELEYNDNNEPVRLIGTIQDITDRKHEQSQVKRSLKFTEALLKSIPIPVFFKDTNGIYTGCNEAFSRLTGFSNDKINGKNTMDIWPNEQALIHQQNDLKLFVDHEFQSYESKIIDKKGRIHDVIYAKNVFYDENGQVAGIVGTFVDISDRKNIENALRKSEQTLQTVLDHFPGGVFWKDANSVYIGCNQTFAISAGLKKPNDISGKTDFELPWGETEALFYRSDDFEVMEKGKTKLHIIEKQHQIDGSVIWFDTNKIPIQDSEGQVIGIIGISTDITERKQAEDAQQKSEQTLLTVLDHFPGVVFWKDKDLNFLGCNQVFASRAGLKKPSEIIGKSDFDMPWGETEALKFRSDDFDIIEKGKPVHILERKIEPDNSLIWFDTNKIPIRDPEGQVIGMIGVSTDITERKQAEEQLRESEEKFRNLADYTDDWEFWIDQHGNILYSSPSCERITGYNPMEFIENPKLLNDIVHPDDQIIFHYHKQMEDEAIEMTREVQYRIVRQDGSIRWIGHVCRPIFNKTGSWIGVRGSNRDITNRKETEELLKTSEHKYKLLSENIADGIFICRKGILEYVNKSMSIIFGYNENEMDGLNLTQLAAPEFKSDLEAFLLSDPVTNQIRIVELECIRKDESRVYVETFLNYIANEKVIYGVVHDITEKKQIQKKNIVKAIINTEEQERAYFSKELHDGLGPLLSTIKLYLQWAKRLDSLKKRKEVILKAEEIVEEALTTVKEISNKLSPHLLTNYGLSSAIQSFANKLEETDAIKITFQSNAGRRIEAEIEVALYRAIIECINNTIKYAKAKNINILLHDTGNQIYLQYKDDGIGFDVSKILSDKKGLGLFNLQNRIQTIGGKIKLSSKPGQGVDYQIVVNV